MQEAILKKYIQRWESWYLCGWGYKYYHTFGKSLIPLKIQKGAKVKTRDLFTFTPSRPAHLRPKIPDWLEMMNVLNQTGQIVQLPLKPGC